MFFHFHAATQSPLAAELLTRVAALYAIERRSAERGRDETGKPVTAVTARLARSRVRRRTVHTRVSEGEPGWPFAA